MTRPRLVLADDHEPLTAMCRTLLESDFDVVAIVSSGEAALAAVREKSPDALVLDVSMPDLSGIEVARELTRCGTPTKIVMLTFHRDPSVVEQAFAAGALGHVAKAHIARDLGPALHSVLAGERFLSS